MGGPLALRAPPRLRAVGTPWATSRLAAPPDRREPVGELPPLGPRYAARVTDNAVHDLTDPSADPFAVAEAAAAVIRERTGAGEARQSGADHHDVQRSARGGLFDLRSVPLEVETLGVACGGPVPDRAEDGTLGLERSVEQAQTPQQAAVGAGIAPVEGEPVVEVDQGRERPLRRRRPADEGLAPGHAHVVVELAVADERGLRQVPQPVTGATPGQPFPRVHRLALVTRVRGERRLRPRRQHRERLHLGVAVDTQVVCELAPHPQLVEELLGAGAPRVVSLACDPQRRHVTVVEVRRQPTDAVCRGVVAPPVVARETPVEERVPAGVAGIRTADGVVDGAHGVVDRASGHELGDVGRRDVHVVETQPIAVERRRHLLDLGPRS